MNDAVGDGLRIEWSSKHWSLLVGLAIGALLGVSGVLLLVYGDGWMMRAFALFFAVSGGAWVYFAAREYFWQRTYFISGDMSEVRWGHSRAPATVVPLAELKRALLHFDSDSQGFSLETRDGREHQWSLLKKERLQALHDHLARACAAEIVKD